MNKIDVIGQVPTQANYPSRYEGQLVAERQNGSVHVAIDGTPQPGANPSLSWVAVGGGLPSVHWQARGHSTNVAVFDLPFNSITSVPNGIGVNNVITIPTPGVYKVSIRGLVQTNEHNHTGTEETSHVFDRIIVSLVDHPSGNIIQGYNAIFQPYGIRERFHEISIDWIESFTLNQGIRVNFDIRVYSQFQNPAPVNLNHCYELSFSGTRIG